jgi:hypothetical protein
MSLLCKIIIVAKSNEVRTRLILAESSQEGYGPKRAVLLLLVLLLLMKMMMSRGKRRRRRRLMLMFYFIFFNSGL